MFGFEVLLIGTRCAEKGASSDLMGVRLVAASVGSCGSSWYRRSLYRAARIDEPTAPIARSISRLGCACLPSCWVSRIGSLNAFGCAESLWPVAAASRLPGATSLVAPVFGFGEGRL